MLLVHHHQTELIEHHAVLKQGMRTDGHPRLAAGDGLQRRATFGRTLTAGQPGNRNTQWNQPFTKFASVLFGQNFRWRHDGRLPAVFDCAQYRQRCHYRLATAHIALQQTVHRMRQCQVGLDLLPGALLRRRELPRQTGQQLIGQRGWR